ncbi:MAG TPA: energy transducer TonB [Sphingomicrobium sp.]|nr:energy transducer TonB [Sphingomicrobium sp.]
MREEKNREFILKHYPPRALAAGEHGIVFFQINLDRDGRLIGCEVTKSSGFPRLDAETCELMSAHGVFKPVRDEAGRLISPTHDGAIKWVLPQGIKPAERPKTLAGIDLPEKLLCRRVAVTGSVIRTERRCLTSPEWALKDDYSRQEVQRLQASGASFSN